MALGFLFAVLDPFFWGMANVLDKYVISHRIRNEYAYIVLWGFIQIVVGVVLALFLDWRGVSMIALLFPLASGIMYGIESFIYIKLLAKQDVTHVIGFIYLYPLITVLLSVFFLKEVLAPLTYGGMAIILLGILLLSVKLSREGASRRTWILLMVMGCMIGVHIFLVKLATNHLTEFQGIAVDSMAVGVTMMAGLFSVTTRRDTWKSLSKIPWVLLANVELLGLAATYFAMARLPASIVASIGAIQLMFVLGFEQIMDRFGGRISKDRLLLPKLIPIALIMIGVVIVFLTANPG